MFAAGIFSCVLQLCCLHSHHADTLRHSLFSSRDVILQERHHPWHPCYAFRSVPDTQRSLTYKGKNPPCCASGKTQDCRGSVSGLCVFSQAKLTEGKTVKQLKSEVDLWFPLFYIPFLLLRFSPFLRAYSVQGTVRKMMEDEESIDVVLLQRSICDWNSWWYCVSGMIVPVYSGRVFAKLCTAENHKAGLWMIRPQF